MVFPRLGCGGVVVVVLVVVAMLCSEVAEAKVMGVGRGGSYGRKGKGSGKPWNTGGKGYGRGYFGMNFPGKERTGPPPCVGLCYYLKLRAIERAKAGHPPEATTPVPTGPTKRPCVGLCYYYKSRGMKNPWEDYQRKKEERERKEREKMQRRWEEEEERRTGGGDDESTGGGDDESIGGGDPRKRSTLWQWD